MPKTKPNCIKCTRTVEQIRPSRMCARCETVARKEAAASSSKRAEQEAATRGAREALVNGWTTAEVRRVFPCAQI